MTSVCIITPAYNVGCFLAETIGSVLRQTLTSWKYLIIDDGSTDDSGDIAEAYAGLDSRINTLHQANSGLARTRNRGLDLAGEADYIVWLDGDDLWEPTFLERLVPVVDEYHDVAMCFSDRLNVDIANQVIDVSWRPERWVKGWPMPRSLDYTSERLTFATLFVQDALTNPSSSLFRVSACKAIGYYSPVLAADD